MSALSPLIDVHIAAVHTMAEEMNLYELAPSAGHALPPAEPGAHIDVHLPGGLVRQYSLVNHGAAPRRYLIGVKREAAGRGGSLWLHDQAREGTALRIGAPRNHFPLHPEAAHSILIAGGIGITPIYNMAQQLQAQGRSWELHYGCRASAWCAFHDALRVWGDKVRFYFDDLHGPGTIDFAALARHADEREGTHLYCCGPQGMLAAYERGTAGLPPGQVHLEHFAARAAAEAAPAGDFVVELARSGRELRVPAARTILDCLTEIGIDVPYSCSQGVCGSCETRVLEGTPDHRDVVLSPEERAANKTLMVCCSRALSPRLKLDL